MLVHIARIVGVVACLGLVGCGDEKKPGPKAPKKAAEASGDFDEDPNEGGTTPVTDTAAASLRITPVSGSGTSFEFDGVDDISIAFAVSGDEGHAVSIALLDAPSGATLRGANSSQPTFSWASPRKGTHSFRFLLRDMDACQAAEGSLSACELDDSVTGASGSYDTTSSRFTLEIANSSTTDISSDGDLGSGGNSDLIAQILQGFGGGGGDIQGLLQGLSNGQLQQILQGQGSGLDLASIIQLISGFGLTGTVAAGGDEG